MALSVRKLQTIELLRKVSRKTGLPPGSLVHIGHKVSEKVKIRLIDYNEDHFEEKGEDR